MKKLRLTNKFGISIKLALLAIIFAIAFYILPFVAAQDNSNNSVEVKALVRFDTTDLNVLLAPSDTCTGGQDCTFTPLKFPDTAKNESKTLSYTVTNLAGSGSGITMTVTNQGISGTNASEYSVTGNCSSPIPPQGSCTFSTQFSPTAVGTRTANWKYRFTFSQGSISNITQPLTGECLECKVQPLTPLTDPISIQFEAQNGQVVSTENFQPAMQAAYQCLGNAVAANGGQLTLTSGYRPAEYQKHLGEVWDRWNTDNLRSINDAVCQTLKTQVQQEINRHQLQNLRIRPGRSSRHVQGNAIDVNFAATGLSEATVVQLAAGCGLSQRFPTTDRVHFTPSSLPFAELDEHEHFEGNFSGAAVSPVLIGVSQENVNGQVKYKYRVLNNAARPITAILIGYDSTLDTPNLMSLPVGWDYFTGLPASSISNPNLWQGDLVTVEENNKTYLRWGVTQNTGKILVGQSLRGFSITVPAADLSYSSSNSSAALDDGSIVPAVLFRDTSNPVSDFDGDGKADQAVFRPSDRGWYLLRSTHGFSSTQFGVSTDRITPSDFDGDGKTDIAVFRNGVWYWLNSSNGVFNASQFGIASDIPVPSDFTGDGRAELAVYRSGVWYTLNLANNQFQAVQFGISSDKPVPADFDGDGKTDFAVYRNGVWYMLRSTAGFTAVQFGISSDRPTVGDYDGDSKADPAVYRSGVWYVLGSSQGFYGVQFGISSDIPVAADYDGDGKTDIAVYRNGVWYMLRSQQGFAAVQFGTTNDRPIPAAYAP
jgi:hypothetical protein